MTYWREFCGYTIEELVATLELTYFPSEIKDGKEIYDVGPGQAVVESGKLTLYGMDMEEFFEHLK